MTNNPPRATASNLSGVVWNPVSAVAIAVDAAGFTYIPSSDIIVSKMNAAQRNFGYAYQYDAASPCLSMAIQCEPVFFEYDQKYWMIEFWKGQYGLETGAEIGIYNRLMAPSFPKALEYQALDPVIGARPDGDPNGRYYGCADDSDRLECSFTLLHNGVELFSRGPEVHWWLTGFRWGVFSQPQDLTMNVQISLKDQGMLEAFAAALSALGYTYETNGLEVSFSFEDPKSGWQPVETSPAVFQGAQVVNEQLVNLYNAQGFTSNDPNVIPNGSPIGTEILRLLQSASLDGLVAALDALGVDGSVVLRFL